jgi:cytidylate kinase
MEDLLMDLQARDDRDTNRAIAPLVPAEGAHVLDTSNMTAEAAVDQVLQWYAAVGK